MNLFLYVTFYNILGDINQKYGEFQEIRNSINYELINNISD